MEKFFKSKDKKYKFPLFFPDATRGFVKSVDMQDVKNTNTPGVLVNTYHLYKDLGLSVIKKFGGVRQFMNWDGATISDSGGFQIMSLAKSVKGRGVVNDNAVTFKPIGGEKFKLTPEDSIKFQMELGTDLIVCLDDFTPPQISFEEAKDSVDRTILWAKRSRKEFDYLCKARKLKEGKKPYLIGVVQGGEYLELRKRCLDELVKIGFDGLGYGGWPINSLGEFNYDVAKLIADLSPKSYILYGLGIGKPNEVVNLSKMGYKVFDCVLPTRDARHKRLYVYNASSIDKIDIEADKFFSYYVPDKQMYYKDKSPVSCACDCLLCSRYSRAYLSHLFRNKEPLAQRLASIHNLRFYSILMEKCQKYFYS